MGTCRSASSSRGSPINMSTSADGFKSKEIFDTISKSLAEDGKTLVGKVKGIYGFKVKNGPDNKEGFWIVDAKNGLGSVEFNGKGEVFGQTKILNAVFLQPSLM